MLYARWHAEQTFMRSVCCAHAMKEKMFICLSVDVMKMKKESDIDSHTQSYGEYGRPWDLLTGVLYQPRLLLRQTRPSNAYCITTTRNILRLFIAADALTLSQHLGLYEIIAISIYRPNPAIFAAIVCSKSASTAGSSSRPGRAYSSLNNASKNRSA